MGRHVRPARGLRVWAAVERWLLAWAARTGTAWNGRRSGAPSSARMSGRRILREAGLAVGLVAAAAGVYGLMFILAGHHTGLGPATVAPGGTSPSHVAASTGGGGSPAVQPEIVANASAVAAAEPTPPANPAAVAAASSGPTKMPAANVSVHGARSDAAAHTGAGAAAPASSATDTGASSIGAAPVLAASTPPATPAVVASSTSPLGPTQPPPALQRPVPGPVLAGFGWAYSQVFGDWQEHTGVDLGASIGDVVAAPGAGVVVAVREDKLWGWVVSIALDRGYSTNVSALGHAGVKPGQALRPGQEIGTVGAAPPAEALLAPHVFWQLFTGSRPLNPLDQ